MGQSVHASGCIVTIIIIISMPSLLAQSVVHAAPDGEPWDQMPCAGSETTWGMRVTCMGQAIHAGTCMHGANHPCMQVLSVHVCGCVRHGADHPCIGMGQTIHALLAHGIGQSINAL
eukprot:9856832-Karenia_brevis.AAC.1